MPEFYPDWNEPATKGDLISLGLSITRVLTQTLALELVSEDSKVTREMVTRKLAAELRKLSLTLDTIGGSPAIRDFVDSASDE